MSKKKLYAAMSGQGNPTPSLIMDFMQGSIQPTQGGGTTTFTRASTAYVMDHEWVPRVAISGEARFRGQRRVRNLVTDTGNLNAASWNKVGATAAAAAITDPDGGTAAYTITATAPAGLWFDSNSEVGASHTGSTYASGMWVRRRTGTGIVYLVDNTAASRTTIVPTSSWQFFSSVSTGNGIAAGYVGIDLQTSGDAVDVYKPQLHLVDSSAYRGLPEFIATPLVTPFHGANVAGVKYFPTDVSGGTLPANNAERFFSTFGTSGNYISAPDSNALDITGDIDIDAEAALADWTPSAAVRLVCKRNAGVSYDFYVVGTNGFIGFFNGTTYESTAAVPVQDGQRIWVRVKRKASTGDVTFYYSYKGVTWTQLGTTLAGAAGPLTVSTEALFVGAFGNGTSSVANGRIFRARVYNGFRDEGGTLVADFNPTRDATDGAASFVSATGETWTINGSDCRITERLASGRKGIMVEPAETNLVAAPEDFSNVAWTAVGTPTRVAAARRCGAVVLDLIGDDSAAAVEGYQDAITFTGNADKPFSIHVARDTSTSSVFEVRDTTAGTNRCQAAVTWVGETPICTMATGTFVEREALTNGTYRLKFMAAGVVAANANVINVYPATTSAGLVANVGNIYAGGVMTSNADRNYSYHPTARADENPYKDDSGWVNQAEGTIVVQFTPDSDAGTFDQAAFDLETDLNNRMSAYRNAGASTMAFFVVNGGATQANIISGATTARTSNKVAVAYKVNDFAASVNGAAVGTDGAGTVPATNRIYLGRIGTAGSHLGGTLDRLYYYRTRENNERLVGFSTATS